MLPAEPVSEDGGYALIGALSSPAKPAPLTGLPLVALPKGVSAKKRGFVVEVRNPRFGDRKLTGEPVTGTMAHEWPSLPAASCVRCALTHRGCLQETAKDLPRLFCPGLSFVLRESSQHSNQSSRRRVIMQLPSCSATLSSLLFQRRPSHEFASVIVGHQSMLAPRMSPMEEGRDE